MIRISALIVLLAALLWFTALYARLTEKSEVRYNCELAEISPDFPAKVRKQCRELRAKQ